MVMQRFPQRQPAPEATGWCGMGVLLGVALLLVSCSTGGDTGTPPENPRPADPQFVQQVLDLYRTAVLQEDIDRLQEILVPANSCNPPPPEEHPQPRQEEDRTIADIQTFCTQKSKTFRTRTITALQIPAETVQIAPDEQSVTFLEVESLEDPETLAQITRLFRTTFQLIIRGAAAGGPDLRINGVQRTRPLVQTTTPGQVQAGALTRVEVTSVGEAFALTGVEVEVPETQAVLPLVRVADENRFHGLLTPPTRLTPAPLRVRLQRSNGTELVLPHRYRLRFPRERVVQPIAVDVVDGTAAPRFFAVAVAPDGTIWGGATGGRIYQIPRGDSKAIFKSALTLDPRGRVDDIAVDTLGRVHFLVRASGEEVFPQAHQDVVLDEDVFCGTVNPFDPNQEDYPFLVRDADGDGQPARSPSTRAVAARDSGKIWLYGSDGGVALVEDDFRDGQCPARVAVRYAPIFRRAPRGLLSNTVPALVVGVNGPRWFGTALGLQNGQFAPFLFDANDPPPSSQREAVTLEVFFSQVVQALHQAMPLTTVRLNGGLSFVERFGRPLIKEDIIFSLVEDTQRRLWIGTLGGGIRRLEGGRQTRHLTHLDGLPSNLILALAAEPGPDGAIWAATDAGVSRIQASGKAETITTFGALDGLVPPVWDVAVAPDGTVWLATNGGLFRLTPQVQGGSIEGRVVRDLTEQPVAGVDVVVQDTPFRAVTDTEGRFVLAHLPLGPQRLMFDSRLAAGAPVTSTLRDTVVTTERQELEVRLVNTPQFTAQEGDRVQVRVGGAPHGLTVRVTNRFGAPVAGMPVTFRITCGDGRLAPEMVRTDAEGQASTTLRAGEGINCVEASARDLEPVIFTVTGMAITPRLIAVGGNNQVGLPGQILQDPFVVQVQDQLGNPLRRENITAELFEGVGSFILPTGAGQCPTRPSQIDAPTTRTTRQTDDEGRARFCLRVDSPRGVVRVITSAPEISRTAAAEFRADIPRILVGDFPSAVVMAKLNPDDHPDLITANELSNDISVLLSRGDGSFAPQQRFPVGFFPRALVAADLNDDDRLDVVTANAFSNDVAVLLSRGDGSFAPQQRFPVGRVPVAVAVADVNGDGYPDLVTANALSNDVSVLRGQGDGSFAPPRRFAAGRVPSAVAVEDFDGDGVLDLVTANAGSDPADPLARGTVSVLLGHRDGAFAPPRRFSVGREPVAIVVEDLNGDNIPDLVTANAGSATVSVLLGRGDGSFAEEQSISVGDDPLAVAVADLDGDGDLDLVTANASSNDVSVLLGRGGGAFLPQRLFGVGFTPRAIVIADLNGDKIPDLVTANARADAASFLIGRGDGAFVAEQRFRVGDRPVAVAVADFNRDGRLDVVTANTDSHNISVLRGRGDSAFVRIQRFRVHPDPAADASPVAVAVQDLDRDGRLDVITANAGSNNVSVLRGNADESFDEAQLFNVGASPVAVAVADVNGDGILDLVTATTSVDPTAVGTVVILRGRRDGSFTATQPIEVGRDPRAVAVADLNGDEILDLVTANAGSNNVSILRGRGDGSFATEQSVDVMGEAPRSVAVADLNGDRVPDLVTANADSDNVSVLQGRRDRPFTFATPLSLNVRGEPVAVVVADLNDDDLPDLITVNANADAVSILLGAGGDSFELERRFGTGNEPVAVTVADPSLNSDDDDIPDVITANAGSNTVSVLLGRGDGSLIAEPRFGVGRSPTNVVVANLADRFPVDRFPNIDRFPDVITANAGSDAVSILQGRGNGSFAGQQRIRVGDNPVAVAVEDFNRDDIPDVVVASIGSAVAVGRFPVAMVVANLNDDDLPDVVTANAGSDNVSVLLGHAAEDDALEGFFAPQQRYDVDAAPVAVAVGDFNRDGRLDLVTANASADNVSVLLGCGPGSAVPAQRCNGRLFALRQNFPAGFSPRAVAVADLNDDQHPDLITVNALSNDVSVLLGHGNGTFEVQQRFGAGDFPVAVAVQDLNRDQHPDLVATNAGSAAVSILLGRGNGTFRAQQRFGVGDVPSAVVVAHLNGDDLPDLVTANTASNNVSVLMGNGGGSFAPAQHFPAGQAPRAVAVEDLDGDGIPDLVTANIREHDDPVTSRGRGNVSILWGRRNGSFEPPRYVDVGRDPAAVAVGDFNHDGIPDLATANETSRDVSVLPRHRIRNRFFVAQAFLLVLLGRQDGSFEREQRFGVGNNPVAVAVAALNGDRHLDLVTANASSDDVSVLLGNGDGSFDDATPRRQRFGVGNNPVAVAVAALDGDRHLDLVTANAGSDDVSVLLGNGDGSFRGQQRFGVGSSPRSVAVEDFDGDGRLDLVTANAGSDDVSVLLGNGDGSFRGQQRFGVGSSPRSVAVATLDAGRVPDLVTANANSNDVSVLLGNGDGAFAPEQRFIVGRSPRSVAVADFNRNGRPDLVTANTSSNDVSILLGHGDGSFGIPSSSGALIRFSHRE